MRVLFDIVHPADVLFFKRPIEKLLARDDVMIGFGGIARSHVGRLTGTPSISFYDNENARLQASATWPFISQLYVPESYTGATPGRRTTRVPGTKELSYLHPNGFTPDFARAVACGLDPQRDNFFVRIVSWPANHDIGKSGWTAETLRRAIHQLGAKGNVHLSSEAPLTDDVDAVRYRGPISSVHHLMEHCRLLVGESATMASAAAILGVPAI